MTDLEAQILAITVRLIHNLTKETAMVIEEMAERHQRVYLDDLTLIEKKIHEFIA